MRGGNTVEQAYTETAVCHVKRKDFRNHSSDGEFTSCYNPTERNNLTTSLVRALPPDRE
ncbi:hypothetical protein OS493_025023 [Desmophyllum pertusum]|uniref:Uncharacterized protein n=1 Tax=Desmophyllum pertusum TaxID=174260 RepID=A0A9W9YLM1_9CNID|nr:hypothetical protein OS493_025023 [Desmophyllum pertusum]